FTPRRPTSWPSTATKAPWSTAATPGKVARAASTEGESFASMLPELLAGRFETHSRFAPAAVVMVAAPRPMAGRRLPSTQARPTAAPTATAITDVRFGWRARFDNPSRAGP